MSNRIFAIVFVGLTGSLGWFWRIAVDHGWLVTPLGVIAEMLLIAWLWHRLGPDA